VAREEAAGAVRFSLGDDTTEDEIRYVVERLPAALSERLAA
jgi:cysteine sulfinate desulfinase/cysteine desulfurase-like protein